MKTAQQLLNEAFDKPRSARSPEYKAGLLANMKYRMKETPDCQCPHAEGTAAYDAWWSGVTESWLILETNNSDKRRRDA